MKCSRHPQEEAVAQCAECGAFVCKKCTTATGAWREKFGTLCVDCNGKKLKDLMLYYSGEEDENKKKIIVSIIFYILGWAVAIFPIIQIINRGAQMLLNPLVLVMLIGGIILCGFYTAISWWKDAEREHEEYEQTHGVQYTITENGIYREKGTGTKVLYFLGGAVFGVALTPIMLLVYIFRIKKAKKNWELTKETYDMLMSV